MEREIIRVLQTEEPLHVLEIAKRLDGHPITVDQACARLQKHGYISMIGGGRYRVTDDGYDYLDDDYPEHREHELA